VENASSRLFVSKLVFLMGQLQTFADGTTSWNIQKCSTPIGKAEFSQAYPDSDIVRLRNPMRLSFVASSMRPASPAYMTSVLMPARWMWKQCFKIDEPLEIP